MEIIKQTKFMRVGINVSFLRKPGTGIGEVTRNFLRALQREIAHNSQYADWEFFLYADEDLSQDVFDGDIPAQFHIRTFLPPYTRDDLIRKIWWEKFLLPRLVYDDQCDVFVSLYQCPTILRKIPHIMVVHDIIPTILPIYNNTMRKKLYWHLTKRAIKKVQHIISVSKYTEKDVIAHLGIDAQKITTMHIDCDPIFKKPISEEHIARTLRKYDLHRSEYIYFGGGLDIRKNAERLVYAYKKLRTLDIGDRTMPDLVISGRLQPQLAPLITDIEKLTRELNLTQFVRILGFVPQEDLPALYAGATLFVYPSLYEGFGLPVLEAMNLSVPVVASKASSVPEVARDATIYCNPYDTEDMARSMRSVLMRDDLRQSLRARGPQRARAFSWEKFAQKLLHNIEQTQ